MIMGWENPPGRRPPDRDVPQNLDEIVRWLKERYRLSPSSGLRPILLIVVATLLVLVGLNSYYTVEPQETAVILRFGKYVGVADAGLHFKIPFGIESVLKVPTGRVPQREYGYRTLKAGERSSFTEKGYEEEALMLSGDLNVLNIQWTVQYKVKDPVEFLFRLSGVEATLDDMSESVVRRIVGNRYADEVLTVGRASIAEQARKEIQEIMDSYHTGLQIVSVMLQNVNAPNPVRAAFNEVNEAGQEKERMINEAQQAYNQKIPKAQGEARQTITQAEGYALERINRAEGEVKRFSDILAEYRKAPEVTRRRMYLDSFETMMGRIDHLYVIDEGQKGILQLLDLNKMKGPGDKPQAGGAPAAAKNP
jgi:modulator of FtsH protease HflK